MDLAQRSSISRCEATMQCDALEDGLCIISHTSDYFPFVRNSTARTI